MDQADYDAAATLSQSEDWTSLPELPTSSELNPDWERDGDEIRARVRLNDVTQPYYYKDEYLRTHYFLQREDGVTNLRKSISDFKLFPKMMDNDDTCIYTKVFIKGYQMTNQGPLCRISFSTERAGKKIRWSNTRRLTPGTIVALSASTDRFECQCKVASIVEKIVEGPIVTIHILWASVDDAVFDPMEELVMIESRHGFYEAIRHSLVGLQYVATTPSPLIKYLVLGSKADATPQYVQDHPEMDITPLLTQRPPDVPQAQNIMDVCKNVNVLDGIPSIIEPYTSLDDSQLQAVHRILTKELAIIQGPPGTGKTFTSVQALRILIQSQDPSTSAPIIVAAETNHAVDQILKQLIGLGLGDLVVRLGGRTKDQNLKDHSVHNLRKRAQHTPDDVYNHAANNTKKSFSSIYSALDRNRKQLRDLVATVFTDSLLKSDYLLEEGIITQDQYQCLMDEDWGDGDSDIMRDWLGPSCCHTAELRRFYDPMFDTEEICQEDEVEGAGLEMEDDVAIDDLDSGRLKGTWIDIDRLYGGSNAKNYLDTDIALKKQLHKKKLWDIDQQFRGAIYEHWQKRLVEGKMAAFRDLLANNMRLTKNLKDARCRRDSQSIKKMQIKIVGCTTTGLSKYRDLISAIQPRVLLVEEAAQSREAQITAALLPSLQQLVLVGDHQQLAPHCSVPGLAGCPYHLCTSMFERLVKYMQMPFTVLEVQRRMIPEARQVLSHFYKKLRDHPMVEDPIHRPPIPGMKYPLYFCHHSYPEGVDAQLNSMYNIEEAEHIVKFAEYLIMNGTPAEKITILTFYRGQRKKIMQEAAKRPYIAPLASLKVNTVDSYQGEENDVILLSLVRSSRPKDDLRVGFVEDMHRGVVAISRARRGFYIFGNYHNVINATDASKMMWGPVRDAFQRGGFFDARKPGLPIYCVKHNKTVHMDYAVSWDGHHGGCFNKCGEVFPSCGHPCHLFCHPMPHEKLRCKQPCERLLRCGHACSNDCGDKCRCSRSCAAFDGIPLPPNQTQSVPIHYSQAWTGYNAQSDDRRVAAMQYTDGASDMLIDVAPRITEQAIVDKFRLVTLSPDGTRAVGDEAVVVNSSASVSPSKSTDIGQDVSSHSPTSSAKSSNAAQISVGPKKPMVPAVRRSGNARTSNNTGRRRPAPASIVPPIKLTLNKSEKNPSPVVAEWERQDEEDMLIPEVVGGSTAAKEKAQNEVKNLIDFD
ncbi:helicase-like protein [Apiospora aurea]|uniref:Helicase-like protein n=1 Tax=Apiospora aurea TaxID=335848 RepID=A0ABR1Q387_9PEZI